MFSDEQTRVSESSHDPVLRGRKRSQRDTAQPVVPDQGAVRIDRRRRGLGHEHGRLVARRQHGAADSADTSAEIATVFFVQRLDTTNEKAKWIDWAGPIRDQEEAANCKKFWQGVNTNGTAEFRMVVRRKSHNHEVEE
jgi:hypothetical protein